MKPVLLVIGGIVQVALAAVHVAMFFAPLPASAKPTAYALNGCVTVVPLFFAYLCFFRRRELVETAMGRVLCWSIVLFYAHTVGAGTIRTGRLLDDPFRFACLLPVTLLYAFVAAPNGRWQALLTISGILQALLALLHVTMFFGSATLVQLPENLKRSFPGFNAAVVMTVLGLAYLCLFKGRELVETSIGRAVCWFSALFYLQRSIVGLACPGFDECGVVWALLALGLVHAAIAVAARPQRGARTTPVAA